MTNLPLALQRRFCARFPMFQGKSLPLASHPNVTLFCFTFICVAVLMALYETAKELYFDGTLTLWQSHIITVFVTATFAAFVALVVRARAERLIYRTEQARGIAAGIITHISDGIIIIDAQGVIETFNPSAEAMFRFKAEEVIGANVSMLMPEDIAREHDSYLHRYLASGEARILGKSRMEVQGRRSSGEIFPMELLVSEMRAGGRLRFIGVVRDVTEERRAAEALLRLQQAERRALEGLRSELKVASAIQSNMLPKGNQLFAEVPRVRAFGLAHPAKEVGGDFFDAFAIDATHVVFAIGDVSGKGIPAALFMMETIALLRSRTRKPNKLGSALLRTNQELCSNNDTNMFVTLFIGELNLETGELQYINAGHCPPLLARRESPFEVFGGRTGIMLGVSDQAHYDVEHARLDDGDTLVLFTDGITEAENEAGEFFSLERAIQVLGASDGDPRILAHSLRNEIGAFCGAAPQSDDITMLVVKFDPSREARVGEEFFAWSDDLGVGVPQIDDQHKTLIALINQLYDEVVVKNTDSEVIDDVLQELAQYAEMHFDLEERLLAEAGYPEFERHQHNHAAFRTRLLAFQEQGGTHKVPVNAELITFLKNWLQSHIAVEDKRAFQSVNSGRRETLPQAVEAGIST